VAILFQNRGQRVSHGGDHAPSEITMIKMIPDTGLKETRRKAKKPSHKASLLSVSGLAGAFLSAQFAKLSPSDPSASR
jgi:hypothetical protein